MCFKMILLESLIKLIGRLEKVMTMPLHIELLRHQLIRDRLLAAYPDLDQETLLDTLEGASDLNEMLGAITRAYLDDRAFAAALKQRLDDMRIRLNRLETATANKRNLIDRESLTCRPLRQGRKLVIDTL